MRIFVVENHGDTLDCLAFYLQEIGHTVESACSMAEALEKIPAANCDVLMSDIGLPDGDGWELLQNLGKNRPHYAVAMSGFGRTSDRLKSKAAGYRHHLLKPVTPDQVDQLLEEARQEKSQTSLN